MRAGPCSRMTLVVGLVAIVSVAASRAQDPADPKSEKQKRLDRQVEESLGWYRLLPDAKGEGMKPRSVLRWVNDNRRVEGESSLVLWMNAGRPEALASVYPWKGNLVHEIVSLARGDGMVARDGDRTLWTPGMPGVSFRDVPDAPAPAESAVARLKQMRALADRFKATMTGWQAGDGDREELRMLPKPVYRYDLADAKATHPDLIDGAVFAFVQGTDPEAVLMLEAVRLDGRDRWQFAFGRSTCAGVAARLDASVVWTAPKVNGAFNPKIPMFAVGRPLSE